MMIHKVYFLDVNLQGVMMTHGNVLATVSAVMKIVPNLGNKDVYLAYLPLAHILELAAEVLSMWYLLLCKFYYLFSLVIITM